MTDPQGYVYGWRKEIESRIWGADDPRVYKIWRYLIYRARFTPATVNGIRLRPGEILTSYQAIADGCYPGDPRSVRKDWAFGYWPVRRLVQWLAEPYEEEGEEKEPEIDIRRAPKGGGLIISIRKWGEYQRTHQSGSGKGSPPAREKEKKRQGVAKGLTPSHGESLDLGLGDSPRGRQGVTKERSNGRMRRTLKELLEWIPKNAGDGLALFVSTIEAHYRERLKRSTFRYPLSFSKKHLGQAKTLIGKSSPEIFARAVARYPLAVDRSEYLRKTGGYTWTQFVSRYDEIVAAAEADRDPLPEDFGVTEEEAEENRGIVKDLVQGLADQKRIQA